jgi:uncharacterized protein YjbI with pentapeptide repeats
MCSCYDAVLSDDNFQNAKFPKAKLQNTNGININLLRVNLIGALNMSFANVNGELWI